MAMTHHNHPRASSALQCSSVGMTVRRRNPKWIQWKRLLAPLSLCLWIFWLRLQQKLFSISMEGETSLEPWASNLQRPEVAVVDGYASVATAASSGTPEASASEANPSPRKQQDDTSDATVAVATVASTHAPSSQSSVKVAYVISITSCPPANMTPTAIFDGPAVLAHSIQKLESRYPYDLVAMVLPSAMNCTSHLPLFGYKLIERDLGFTMESIGGRHDYQRYIRYDGCCGESEFLKLEAYTLLEYDVVVHLDTDLLILKPMDGIIDAMIGIDNSTIDVLHKDRPLPEEINFMFTRDYVQMSRWTNDTSKFAVQGGFFAIKPDKRVYRRLIGNIQKGKFNLKNGWNLQGYAGYYGAPQIQGLLSYFYGEHYRQGAVELNPCIYNSMVSFPPHTADGRCRYNTTDGCQDCRDVPLSQLHSTHFTVCYKPWVCPKHKYVCQLCKETHRAWFEMRREVEVKWKQAWPPIENGFNANVTLGYCTSPRATGYIPMQLPKLE